MRQLIRVIDHARVPGLDGEASYHHDDGGCLDPEAIYDFATTNSDFQPELHRWCNGKNPERLERELKRVRADDY